LVYELHLTEPDDAGYAELLIKEVVNGKWHQSAYLHRFETSRPPYKFFEYMLRNESFVDFSQLKRNLKHDAIGNRRLEPKDIDKYVRGAGFMGNIRSIFWRHAGSRGAHLRKTVHEGDLNPIQIRSVGKRLRWRAVTV